MFESFNLDLSFENNGMDLLMKEVSICITDFYIMSFFIKIKLMYC